MPRRLSDDDDDFAYEENEDEAEGEDSLDDDEEEALDDDEIGDVYMDDDDGEFEEGSTDAGDLDALIDDGNELIENGEYKEAIDHFEEVVESYPEEALSHYHLGRACYCLLREEMESQTLWEDDAELLELHERAIGCFDSALELDPDHIPSLNALGALYAVRGNHRGAVECWEKSLELDGDQEEVRNDLEEAKSNLDE